MHSVNFFETEDREALSDVASEWVTCRIRKNHLMVFPRAEKAEDAFSSFFSRIHTF